MKAMINASVLIKSVAGAYCSDKKIKFEFPATHHILAGYEGHEKFFVVVPWDTHEEPLPEWKPRVYEDGRIVMNPIRGLEYSRKCTCKTGEYGPLWVQTGWGASPQMCVANKGPFGWEYTWTMGTEVDLNPELTSSEQDITTLLNLKD